DRVHRPVVLAAGLVRVDGPAGVAKRARVVPAQVRADPLPAVPLIDRPEDMLGRRVDGIGIRLAGDDRSLPLLPFLAVPSRVSHRVVRPDADVADLVVGEHAEALVENVEILDAPPPARVEDPGVAGVDGDLAALGAAGVEALAAAPVAGHARSGAVLLLAAHEIRDVGGDCAVVHLRGGVGLPGPAP